MGERAIVIHAARHSAREHRAPCRPVPLGHDVVKRAQRRDAHKSLPLSGPWSSHLSSGYNHPHPTQLIKANRAESTLESEFIVQMEKVIIRPRSRVREKKQAKRWSKCLGLSP